MATVRVEAQIAPEDLLQAIEQLEPAELERFIERALALRARRRAPTLPAAEATLLAEINQSLPTEIQTRYDDLLIKRRAEQLSPAEHAELLRLTEQVEGRAAERVRQLAQLAQLRGVPLRRLMDDLGVHPRPGA
jgi:hypothetical protein